VAPDTDQRQLSWLADRIGQWQSATLDVAGARAALAAARKRCIASLDSISAALGGFGYDALDSTARLAGALDDLERRVSNHAREVARAEEACRRVAELERSSAALECECAELLERVGVRDDAAVENLCASFEEYRSACEGERFTRQACEALTTELRAAPGYDVELESGGLAVLERGRVDAAAAAAQFDELTARVARLEQEVETAKRASDVEAAVAAVKAARSALVEQRDRDLRAMMGGVVARHVQRLTRDQHRPEVFRRARELFTLITRGRYRLDFEDGDTPSFRAFDVNAGVGRSLDELSSATRVQLLLAVRVAFVESQERRVALPLLLDETLGTSDDDRARAIIDAVIVLAREGRQIFYFTAQHDEAGKWVAALEESGVPHATVDLAAARGHRSSLALAPLAISSVSALDVPEPDGCTHDDYGARVRVSAFRPGLDAPDSVPLWYVVDDVDELCRMMQSGIVTWGELRNLVENGGDRIVESCPTLWRRARAYAGALEALCREAAIGLGRPVDRSVLLDSGAVSEIQIERVLSLCERCRGDARALVAGLEDGGVSGFQKRKIAALREYLEEKGYLDERVRRTEAQLRAAMLAAIARAVSAGDVRPADIDVLLHRLELRRTSVDASAAPRASQTDSLAARISEG
jgi:cell division protein FtsB